MSNNLGEVVGWSVDTKGTVVHDVRQALATAGFEPDAAKDLNAKHAWGRAIKSLKESRSIDKLVDEDGSISFQFTRKAVLGGRFDANKTDQVLEWLEHFENGATSLCIPVDKLPAAWSSFGCPKGQTDIVQITDAICRIPAETVARFNTWKKQEQVRFLTIVIAEAAGEAAKISDDCWVYNSMAAGSDAINDILRKV